MLHTSLPVPGDTWTQQQKLTVGGSSFGYAVDVDGNKMIVGAPEGGRAYIFEKINNRWEQDVALHANYIHRRVTRICNKVAVRVWILTTGNNMNNKFGSAVAMRGDRVIVGAFKEGAGNNYYRKVLHFL